MKLEKSAPLSKKDQSRLNSEDDPRQKAWGRIGLRLAAVFLVIVFLTSECAALLPVQ